MKKKTKSILAVVLAILLIIVVAITLTTNILFSRKDTPKIFGHYIYLMQTDVMEAGSDVGIATGNTDANAAGTTDAANSAASIHQHTAVIAKAYSEADPIAKNNAVLCVLAADDTSTDADSDRVAVRRIYSIDQDETGMLKYYPTTMQADSVGTEPPITVDSILGKCAYESGELYTYITFATSVPGILTLLVLPSVILVIMLIVAIVRANGKHDDEYAFEENYDEVFSEDSYDADNGYEDEELGGRSPLYRSSGNSGKSASFEQKRSSIAQNFERKAVNPNSPYQKARTMQFKAQHDIPIYTNPEDQLPIGSNNTDTYEGAHSGSVSNTASFGSIHRTAPISNFGSGPIASHASDAPVAPETPTYRGSHEASSPEEARNLGSSRFTSSASRPETAANSAASAPAAAPASKPAAKPTGDKYATASVDELLAMIEDEKHKLDQ